MKHSKYFNTVKHIEKVTGFGFMNLPPLVHPYSEPTRHFHTIFHVRDLVDGIARQKFGDVIQNSLWYAALFHDIVYDPTASDNEEKSAQKAREYFKREWSGLIDIDLACRMIMSTKILDTRTCDDVLARIFNSLDRAILTRSVDELVEYGEQIWKEYSHVSRADFLNGHFTLIRQMLDYGFSEYHGYDKFCENIDMYEKIMRKRKIRLGLYVGSFNPFHVGHNDILLQAESLFDKVVVAVGTNPAKYEGELKVIPEPKNHKIQGVPRRFQQMKFFGLLSDFTWDLEKDGYYDVTIIRGFRDGDDIKSELTQRKYLWNLNPNLKYVFLTSKPGFEHISSSAIRHLQMFGSGEQYTMPNTWENLDA